MKLFTFLYAWLTSMKKQAKETLASESGMATIEVLLIIAVLIALVILFRGVIIGFVSNLLDGISSQGSSFDPATMVP